MASPVTGGLVYDLAAADMRYQVQDGAGFDYWNGSTGFAVYRGAAQAVYRSAQTPNGGPAMHFDNSTYNLYDAGTQFNGSTSAEFFAVVRGASDTNGAGFYQLGGGSYTAYGSSGHITDGAFTATSFTFDAVTATGWHIYNVSHDGTTWTARIDGTVVATHTTSFSTPAQAPYPVAQLGRTNPPADAPNWAGDIAEVVVYNRALSDTDRASVYAYLSAAHGVSAPVAPISMPPVPVAVTTTGPDAAAAAAAGLVLPAIAVTVALSGTEGAAAPAAKVTTGLILDLAAATVGDVDGSTVATWSNSPAGGLGDAVLTSGTAATYRRAGTPNGGPVVRFADAQYTLQNTAALDSSTSAEFFAVLRTDGSTGNGPGFYQFGGADYTYYTFGDGNLYDGSFTNTRFSFPFATPADWHVYNVSHDGTTRTTRIDGVVVHTATVAFTAPSRSSLLPICLLGRQYSNYPWHGDIAEILTYDRSLSSAQRNQVYGFLRATHFDARPAVAPVVCPPVAVVVATVPGAVTDPSLILPALAVQAVVPAATVTEPVTVTLPPVTLTAAAGAPVEAGARTVLNCPPADTGLDAFAPVTVTGTAVPLSPQQIVVPSSRPAFTVTVTNDTSGLQVQAQWSTDPTFATDTADAFTDAPAGLDGAMATLQAGTALPDGVWWWRARLTGPYGPGPWSDPVRFAVDTTEGQAVAAGDLIVTGTAVGAPHLWFIDPEQTGTGPGDDAVIAGTGFGDQPAVMLGTVACTVTAVEQVAATDPPAGPDRQIVPGGTVTPAHQVLTFTIPDVGPDHIGDALTVQRS